MIIGVTGGIGSGKSVVSRILRLKGFAVYDTDLEARKLMDNDYRLKDALRQEVGEDIYTEEGRLHRGNMSRYLFGDEKIRIKVNSLVHSAVKRNIEDWIAANEHESGNDIVFVESAILVTSGLSELCDQIWIVEASEQERVRRVISRNNFSESEVRKRMESQKEEELQLEKLQENGRQVEIIINEFDKSLVRQIDLMLEGMPQS